MTTPHYLSATVQYNLGWHDCAKYQARSKAQPDDADPLPDAPEGWRAHSEDYKTGWLDYLDSDSDPMTTQVTKLRDDVAALSAKRSFGGHTEPGLNWVVSRLDDILNPPA
jgi:hypothetical protein